MMKNGGMCIFLRRVKASFSSCFAMAATTLAHFVVFPPPFSSSTTSAIYSSGNSNRYSCSLTYFRPHLPPACRTILEILFLRDWDASLEADLAQSGVVLTHELVDQITDCIPSPKLALQFFIWSGERIGYPPPASSASFGIAQWYCHKSKVHIFLNILASLNRPALHLSPPKINVLIQGYGWAGMVDRGYEVLSKSQGFCNAILCNCLLHAVVKENRFDMVYKLYVEMQRFGTSLNPSYNILIYGLSLDGRLQEAHLLLEQMVSTGSRPDITAYTTLIRKLSEAGQLDRACKLLQDMVDGNLSPDDMTCNAVLEGLSHAKIWDEAWKVGIFMQKQGCTLYQSTYGSILSGLLDDGKVESAFHWLEIMSTHGLFPGNSMANALVRSLSSIDKADEAHSLLNQMTDKGCAPDASTYAALLECLCNAGKLEEFRVVLQEMEKLDVGQNFDLLQPQN